MAIQRIAPRAMTVADYLDLEARSETKHEFIDGVIVPMTGGSLNHSRIKVILTTFFELELSDSDCIVCNSDMRLGIAAEQYVYPDLSVVCAKPRLRDQQRTLLNPRLVLEVTSPSSLQRDRGRKLDLYRALPSLDYYLIFAQSRAFAELHSRVGLGWTRREYEGLDAVIGLDGLACRLPLSQVYGGIAFYEE